MCARCGLDLPQSNAPENDCQDRTDAKPAHQTEYQRCDGKAIDGIRTNGGWSQPEAAIKRQALEAEVEVAAVEMNAAVVPAAVVPDRSKRWKVSGSRPETGSVGGA